MECNWGPDQMGGEFGLLQVCGPLIVRYAALLAAKARFHAAHRAGGLLGTSTRPTLNLPLLLRSALLYEQ